MNLEEMAALPERQSMGLIKVTHVAVVVDEDTGIVERRPIHFCLAPGGSLDAMHQRVDPDAHLGAVGGE